LNDFVYLPFLGKYAGKPKQCYSGAIMAVTTQDGCNHVNLDPYTEQLRSFP
jgi:hypothetical protein